MAFLVAGLQTAWYRTSKLQYLRATKFFGKLFLINFAIGVVTGIVQEFQFGMNWSSYSRFVGDIFGAPLAMEGLLAFFLESTFLGLWIFGWDRLPKKLHLASIWLAATGTLLSAYFILAANAWMQHPVGYVLNAEKGRAELVDIKAVLTQKTALATFFHTIPSAAFTAGAFIAGISAYLIIKRKDIEMARSTFKMGAITMLISFVLVSVSGDLTARIMTEQQPMKMAAAEALYDTQASAPFSLLTIGTLDGSKSVFQIGVPSMLSFMSTGNFDGVVEGVNDLEAKYDEQFGAGDYTPNVPLAYWSFRLMIGFGAIGALFALLVIMNKAFNDAVHVSRYFAGLPKLEDRKSASNSQISVVAFAKGLFTFIPIHRMFHSVEMTIWIFLLSLIDLMFDLQLLNQLFDVIIPIIVFVSVGHLISILTSNKLRASE